MKMLLPAIHGHPRLWFVLLAMFAALPSIMGNNDSTDAEGNTVESYEDVGVGITQYDSKRHLSFERSSSSKEAGEMPDDDLQGNTPSYATHSCNLKSFTKIRDLSKLENTVFILKENRRFVISYHQVRLK